MRRATPSVRPILVVEDEALIRQVLCSALESDGHVVVVAEDGADACVRAQAIAPDIVIVDLNLPVVDGWEVIRVLRGLERGPRRTHVIALSAMDDGRSRQLAFEAGADEFIAKTDLRDVGGAVRAFLLRRSGAIA